MPELTDQDYLLSDQYKDASNLDARIQLHRRFSTGKRGWMDWVFDQMTLPAESSILELGCGPGNMWVDNIDRIPNGWDLNLSDLSSGMLQQAQDNLRDLGRELRFLLIDAQMIPVASASFDGVIANHMLYHLPDTDRALSEIQRVLRPGGCFYATTVGPNHMREFWGLVTRSSLDADGMDTVPTFRLDNGAEQLSRFFSHVRLHHHDDGLAVTEVEPFIAYALSSSRADVPKERLEEFARMVEQEIATHGAIHIQKEAGMFEARRAVG